MFNTLIYIRKLEKAGLSRSQAEAEIEVMGEMIMQGTATKDDLKVQTALFAKEFVSVRAEMDGLRAEMNTRFAAFRAEMETRFISLEHRLTIRMGAMLMASTTITISALALIVK